MASFYDSAAEWLLELPEYREVARRYLNLKSRQSTLRRHLSRIPKSNLLSRADFHPPLSVAGQPSSVIVRAEHLQMHGVPIAMDYDAKGKHRGQSVSDVAEALGVDESEVIEQYKLLMLRNGRIAKRLALIAGELTLLKGKLLNDFKAANGVRFSCVVEADTFSTVIASVILQATTLGKKRRDVVIGYRNQNIVVGGINVPAIFGTGTGLVVVKMKDLMRVVGGTRREDIIELNFGRRAWVATVGRDERTLSKYRFRYEEGE